jgi:glycosyltransferase involved in cell wall biosynthesis
MRILQVCPCFFPDVGGVQEHVRNISYQIAKSHDVTIATTDPSHKLPKTEYLDSIQILRFNSFAPAQSYFFSRQLKEYLQSNGDKFDLVHAHSYHALPALYAAHEPAIKNFVFTPHYHGAGHTLFRSLLHKPYKYVGRKIFKKAQKIICVSNYEKHLVQDNFNVEEQKIAVIPNGVDTQQFVGLKRKTDSHFVLFVGRLEQYKGIQYLIKALPLLKPEISLQIVGDGPYKKSLLKQVKKLNLNDRVSFESNLTRETLSQRYRDADILALLSKHEAYGLSVVESLAAGTPCIVTNISALSEWIDSENCFGIDYPPQVEAVASVINRVAGLRISRTNLPDWTSSAQKLSQLYKHIITKT